MRREPDPRIIEVMAQAIWLQVRTQQRLTGFKPWHDLPDRQRDYFRKEAIAAEKARVEYLEESSVL